MDWLISKKIITQDKRSDIDYYFRNFLFNFIIIISLLTIGILLHILTPMVIISIVFNTLRLYSFGYHSSVIEKCILITTTSISIMSFLSVFTVNCTLFNFYIAMVSGILIIKHTIDNIQSNQNIKYYINGYIGFFILFIIIGVVSIDLNQLIITNSINFGIFLVVLLLKRKKQKIRK
jgi:hypothetical protein